MLGLLLAVALLTGVFTWLLTRRPPAPPAPIFEVHFSDLVPPGTIYLFPKSLLDWEFEPPTFPEQPFPQLPVLMEQRIAMSVLRPEAFVQVVTS